MYEVDSKGQEHVLQFGPPGWWVGNLYSFLSDTPSEYLIDCLEDSEVLQITRENMEMMFDKSARIERFFRIIIQNAFIASQKKSVDEPE